MRLSSLPWKYVISFNLSLLILGGAFMMSNYSQKSTENRSNASESTIITLPSPKPSVTPKPGYSPKLSSIEPTWAKIGDQIIIKGQDFGTVPFGSLKIGLVYVPETNLIDWSNSQIVIEVPPNTTTAPISLEYRNANNQLTTVSTSQSLEIRTTNK